MSQFISINLPSRCKTYGDILTDLIKIRPLVGRDAELIATLSETNTFRKFAKIIEVTLDGIEATKLTSGDMKFILLWQAINSYTSEFPVTIVCEHCFTEFQQMVDMDKDFSLIYLSETYKEFSEITVDNKVFPMRLLTLADEIQICDWIQQGGSGELYELALTICNDKTVEENLETLRNMLLKDINTLQKFHKDNEHGPDMLASYKCKECGGEGKIEIPFRFETLFSFDR